MGSPTPAAARLRELRKSAGLAQDQLAAASGVSVRTIRGLENGSIREPRRATVEVLAASLNLRGAEHATFVRSWAEVAAGPLALDEILRHDHVVCEMMDDLERQPSRLREIVKVGEWVMDEYGRLAEVTMTRTFEARTDGISRLVWIQNFDPTAMLLDRIRVSGLTNCRAGRTVALSDTVLGHEILLDAPLALASTFLVSYRSSFRDAYRTDRPPSPPETESLTGSTVGIAVQVDQVRFTPPRLPTRIWPVSQRSFPTGDAAPERDDAATTLTLSPFAMAQVVLEQPSPGVHGLRWSWD